jgi:hypothetical protein
MARPAARQLRRAGRQAQGVAGPARAASRADPLQGRGRSRLLDQLPVIDTDLGRLPEDLERELYGGFQLQVRYHHPSRRVTLRVTIDGAAIPQLTATGRAIMADRPTEASPVRHRAQKRRKPPDDGERRRGAGRFPLQGVPLVQRLSNAQFVTELDRLAKVVDLDSSRQALAGTTCRCGCGCVVGQPYFVI